MATPDWGRAACREEDPELFFPIGVGPLVEAQVEQARGVCHGCRIRPDCLEWSFASRQDTGIWGGMTEEERRAEARRRARVAVHT